MRDQSAGDRDHRAASRKRRHRRTTKIGDWLLQSHASFRPRPPSSVFRATSRNWSNRARSCGVHSRGPLGIAQCVDGSWPTWPRKLPRPVRSNPPHAEQSATYKGDSPGEETRSEPRRPQRALGRPDVDLDAQPGRSTPEGATTWMPRIRTRRRRPQRPADGRQTGPTTPHRLARDLLGSRRTATARRPAAFQRRSKLDENALVQQPQLVIMVIRRVGGSGVGGSGGARAQA